MSRKCLFYNNVFIREASTGKANNVEYIPKGTIIIFLIILFPFLNAFFSRILTGSFKCSSYSERVYNS